MTQSDRLDVDPKFGRAPADVSARGEFRSILFEGEGADVARAQEPPFFADLNLDQVVASIVAGRDEYDLKPGGGHASTCRHARVGTRVSSGPHRLCPLNDCRYSA